MVPPRKCGKVRGEKLSSFPPIKECLYCHVQGYEKSKKCWWFFSPCSARGFSHIFLFFFMFMRVARHLPDNIWWVFKQNANSPSLKILWESETSPETKKRRKEAAATITPPPLFFFAPKKLLPFLFFSSSFTASPAITRPDTLYFVGTCLTCFKHDKCVILYKKKLTRTRHYLSTQLPNRWRIENKVDTKHGSKNRHLKFVKKNKKFTIMIVKFTIMIVKFTKMIVILP